MLPSFNIGAVDPIQTVFVVLIIVWILFWKAIALWYAARKSMRGWFIAILIINSFSILEIFYILYYLKENPKHFLRI